MSINWGSFLGDFLFMEINPMWIPINKQYSTPGFKVEWLGGLQDDALQTQPSP